MFLAIQKISIKLLTLVTCLWAAAQASGVRPVLSTALTSVPAKKKELQNMFTYFQLGLNHTSLCRQLVCIEIQHYYHQKMFA